MGTVEQRIERIIRKAVKESGGRALVAMLKPGHFIPLEYTSGAVLDCDYVRLNDPVLGWRSITGEIRADDYPDRKTVTIPFSDIVWISREIK